MYFLFKTVVEQVLFFLHKVIRTFMHGVYNSQLTYPLHTLRAVEIQARTVPDDTMPGRVSCVLTDYITYGSPRHPSSCFERSTTRTERATTLHTSSLHYLHYGTGNYDIHVVGKRSSVLSEVAQRDEDVRNTIRLCAVRTMR